MVSLTEMVSNTREGKFWVQQIL